MVVLVDGRSASAAEILAAALADQGRAVVVGSSTLGKGLVQTIAPLPDGGELFVTWSRVLAPLGWPIQGLGVLPQVCTSLGEAHCGGSSPTSPGAASTWRVRSRATTPPARRCRRPRSWKSATPARPPRGATPTWPPPASCSTPAAYAAALLPGAGRRRDAGATPPRDSA